MKTKKLIQKSIKAIVALIILMQGTSCMMMHLTQHDDVYGGQKIIHDPVCGTVIADTSSSKKYVYGNKTYYFDTEECQKVFQKNPEKFAYTENHHSVNTPLLVTGTVAMTAMMVLMMGFWLRGGLVNIL